MSKTFSTVFRIRPTAAGKRITLRLGRLIMEVRLSLSLPWHKYKSKLYFSIHRTKGGVSIVLRVWKSEMHLRIVYDYKTKGFGVRYSKELRNIQKHRCPICDFSHHPRKRLEEDFREHS